MGHEQSNHELSIVTELPVELIRSEGGQSFISGYAAVWYDPSDKGTEYYDPQQRVYERVNADAFDDVLRSNQNVKARYDHSKLFELGNTETRTLFLRADERGLRYDVPYDESDPDHQRIAAKLRKGLVRGSSFKASGHSRLTKEGDKWISTITKVSKLEDVGPCPQGCYQSANTFIRSQIDRYEQMQERIGRLDAI